MLPVFTDDFQSYADGKLTTVGSAAGYLDNGIDVSFYVDGHRITTRSDLVGASITNLLAAKWINPYGPWSITVGYTKINQVAHGRGDNGSIKIGFGTPDTPSLYAEAEFIEDVDNPNPTQIANPYRVETYLFDQSGSTIDGSDSAANSNLAGSHTLTLAYDGTHVTFSHDGVVLITTASYDPSNFPILGLFYTFYCIPSGHVYITSTIVAQDNLVSGNWTFTKASGPHAIDTTPGTGTLRSLKYANGTLFSVKKSATSQPLQTINTTTWAKTNLNTPGTDFATGPGTFMSGLGLIPLGTSGTNIMAVGYAGGTGGGGFVELLDFTGNDYSGAYYQDGNQDTNAVDTLKTTTPLANDICEMKGGTGTTNDDTFVVLTSPLPAADGSGDTSGVYSRSFTFYPNQGPAISGLSKLEAAGVSCFTAFPGTLLMLNPTNSVNAFSMAYQIAGISDTLGSVTECEDLGANGFMLRATSIPQGGTENVNGYEIYALPPIIPNAAKRASGADIVLTWPSVTGAASFKISKNGGSFTTRVSPYTDTGAAASAPSYVIRAFDSSGNVLAQAVPAALSGMMMVH